MKYTYTKAYDTDTDSYAILFDELPCANTIVFDLKDLENESLDCLETAFEIYVDENKAIPIQKDITSENYIEIPTSLALKVYLHNEFIKSNMRKAELSRKTGIAPPNLDRVFNFRYKSKIEAIEKVFKSLGKHIEVSIS